MSWRHVPPRLYTSVRHYLQYHWETSRGYEQYETELKDELTPMLRRELCFHLYGKTLRDLPFLAWMWGTELVLKDLAVMVDNIFLMKGDNVIHSGMANTKMYVLKSGRVRLSLNKRLHMDATDSAVV